MPAVPFFLRRKYLAMVPMPFRGAACCASHELDSSDLPMLVALVVLEERGVARGLYGRRLGEEEKTGLREAGLFFYCLEASFEHTKIMGTGR
jgi:hypothetical protein